MALTKRYVMIRLPGAAEDVPAGLLTMNEERGQTIASEFAYGKHYHDRSGAIDIDPKSLDLRTVLPQAAVFPTGGLTQFGAIRDAMPDAWGRRVIEAKLKADPDTLTDSVLIDHSSPHRTGALDFRVDRDVAPKVGVLAPMMELEHLLDAAGRIDEGEPVPAHLMSLLGDGPTLGGMRPKSVLVDDGIQWVAKFPSRRDGFDIPMIERATLELARLAGLSVPPTRVVHVAGRGTVMLIARFDRGPQVEGFPKRHMVSALTALGVHEMDSPKMSYGDISDALGQLGATGFVRQDRIELFRRMVFNILVSNDDDHLRNHSLLHDATAGGWRLSPLYDVLPHPSASMERDLHLSVGPFGRSATLGNALDGCRRFGLKEAEAARLIHDMVQVVREWQVHFEALDVPGQQIDKVASAFRKPSQIGLKYAEKHLASP